MATHTPWTHGHACGAKTGSSCLSWIAPTCQRCAEMRPRLRQAYVSMARHLLATRARPVSAGEVAYHVHGHATANLERLAAEADQAMGAAGLQIASWRTASRFADVVLYREAV